MLFPLRDNIPAQRPPLATVGIIGVCVGAFVLQMLSPDHLKNWMFVPADLLSVEAWQERGLGVVVASMVVSMFLHGNLLHIASNMWFLWIFGDNVEDRLGFLRFLGFYLACGLIAALIHTAYTYFKLLVFGGGPQGLAEAALPTVGASGAIAGVLGAYLRLFPGATIRSLAFLFIIFTFIELPALIFIGLWFVLQAISGYTSLFSAWGGGGVAVWAHIGGFVAGYVLVGVLTGRKRPSGPRVVRFDVD